MRSVWSEAREVNAIQDLRARLRTGRWLRACSRVGSHPVLVGKPTVSTYDGGRIELGDRFYLSSRPVASHLISLGLLRIGDDVSIGHGTAVAATANVSIGDRTRIGPFCILMDTDFHGERVRAVESETDRAPVQIGADVYIGAHVTVLRGSRIGDGATIRAGSVLSGRIAPGAFVGGVPARVLDDPADSQEAGVQATDVVSIVTRVFGLSTRPDLRSGPDQIPQWDSLGALRLLLSLEEALGITLDEHVLAEVRSVGDLQAAVESARRQAIVR